MVQAVIVDAVRTPIGLGRPHGVLAGVHPVDLMAITLEALVRRSGLDPSEIEDVIIGCVDQVREQSRNVARNAVLAAGLPDTVPATTVDRQCGSSQQSVHFAAQAIMSGAHDVVVAGGVESMSRVPMWSNVGLDADPFGPRIAGRYPDGLPGQGISAELVAAAWGIGREDLDAVALESHMRAAEAATAGRFISEMTAVPVTEDTMADADEGIRTDTSADKLASLPAAFADEDARRAYPELDWKVTAGNSSQISDGASALLLMSAERAKASGFRALARLHAFSVAAGDPKMMLTAVIPATWRAIERAGLDLADIDLFEVNEAFASVVLAWHRETGVDLARVNVNGGAIALGHPLGASGARLMTTLVHAMQERDVQWGLQTMCEAGGMANATIIERL